MTEPKSNVAGKTPSLQDLSELAYQYYPRWHPARESLDEFLGRTPHSPETRALEARIAGEIQDNRQWHEFLAEIEAGFSDYWVTDGRPPGVEIPSYQLVLGYEYPRNSSQVRYLVFRISFLAPVFDFYESEQNPDTRVVTRHLRPTPESENIAQAIGDVITRRFGHTWLDPEVGATPLLGIAVGNLAPGQVTLADALFEGSRRW